MIAQIERDAKVMGLFHAMNETFKFIEENEFLNKLENYKDQFKAMARQIEECGHFICEYRKDNNFCEYLNSFNI